MTTRKPKLHLRTVATTKQTRMLAINVSIPNVTVARLEQFPSPQMTDKKNHPLHESLMSLSSVRVNLQLMQSQNWLPWQRPLDPLSRLCLHWIA